MFYVEKSVLKSPSFIYFPISKELLYHVSFFKKKRA